MHGAVDGDSWPRRQVNWTAVALRHRGKRAQTVGAIVLASQHRVDTRHFERFGRVDATDIGMHVR